MALNERSTIPGILEGAYGSDITIAPLPAYRDVSDEVDEYENDDGYADHEVVYHVPEFEADDQNDPDEDLSD